MSLTARNCREGGDTRDFYEALIPGLDPESHIDGYQLLPGRTASVLFLFISFASFIIFYPVLLRGAACKQARGVLRRSVEDESIARGPEHKLRVRTAWTKGFGVKAERSWDSVSSPFLAIFKAPEHDPRGHGIGPALGQRSWLRKTRKYIGEMAGFCQVYCACMLHAACC